MVEQRNLGEDILEALEARRLALIEKLENEESKGEEAEEDDKMEIFAALMEKLVAGMKVRKPSQ